MESSTDYQIQYIAKQELRDSNCCRFCGCGASKEVSVSDGFIELYEKSVVNAHDSNPLTLDILVNKYLPIRVSRYELYYPRVICSSCNYALDVTIEFFKKIAVGQKILSTIINESSHDKEESVSSEPNNLQSVSPTMVFSSENPVMLAPKRRGRPRRDPNYIKTPKPVLALPSEFLGMKPKRQSRRPARYNPAYPDSSDCQVVVKDESHEFPTSSETENLFPFLSEAGSLEANKSGNNSDATFSFGKVQIHQLKTDNALLLGSTLAEFTSLTHAENLMDISKLSVIMDGDEEIDSSSLEPIIPTINIIKSDKLSESVTQQHSNISLSGITEEPTEIVSQDLVSWRQDPIACLTINSNEEYRDSGDSVRSIDFVARKKMKRGRKKTRRKNNKKKLECSFCRKEFSHPSSLAYHRNSVHNNEKRFACKICKKAFSHKQLLANHAYVHSDVKGFKCQLCPAKFKSKASLYTHNKSIHTENSGYTCDQCGYQFNLKSSLKAHLRLHTGEKPYSCEFCHKEFSQKSNYSEHRRIHTGERPYKCDTTNCDKAFTTASQLRNHKITHTGTKQYLCSICGRGFTHGENFKYHMRRHNGEKPIECPICLKPFTEPCSLKKHWRLHTGEKPYACEICNKLFSDPSNYAKHKKVHIHEVSSKTVDSLDLDPNQHVDLVSRVEVEAESTATPPIMEGPEHVVEEVGDFNTDEAYVQILNPENLATLDGDTQEGQQVIYLYPHDLSYYTITLSDNNPVEVRPHEETLQTLGSSIAFAAMDADIAAQYFNLETVSDSSVNIPRVADTTEGGATISTTSNNTTIEGGGDFLGSRVIIEPSVLSTV